MLPTTVVCQCPHVFTVNFSWCRNNFMNDSWGAMSSLIKSCSWEMAIELNWARISHYFVILKIFKSSQPSRVVGYMWWCFVLEKHHHILNAVETWVGFWVDFWSIFIVKMSNSLILSEDSLSTAGCASASFCLAISLGSWKHMHRDYPGRFKFRNMVTIGNFRLNLS